MSNTASDLFAKHIPVEWYSEEADTCFARSHNGEGSYYCPSCGTNCGSVWKGGGIPLKAESICYTCKPQFIDDRRVMTFDLPDGSVWGVPVMVIAFNRATEYAYEFDGDIARSLNEDTLPLFDGDQYAITDWAANNMNWEDVKNAAFKVSDSPAPDMQEAWMNGAKAIIQRVPS